MGYVYILFTIIFTVIGQIMLKWRMEKYGALPAELYQKFLFLIKVLMDPFIILSFGSAFLASICWMATMTKFNISYAYPFMSFSYVLVFVISIYMFKEPITMYKITGLAFIVIGILISSRSMT